MTILEKIQYLCKEQGINPSRLEIELGFGKGTLYKWGKSSPTIDKISKVADYFYVSIDYLLGRNDQKLLSRYNHKDIEKVLENVQEQLLTSKGLMFDGKPASNEEIQQIFDAMQIGFEMAKKKNKEK